MNSKRARVYKTAVVLLLSVWLGRAGNRANGAQASSPDWVRHAVPLPESIWSVEAVDANADGKLDLIGRASCRERV